MLTYNELKEKCTCWKGYKRVPGTKPCAEDSCMKEEKDSSGHGSEKHHVLAFGRMNPITHGHEAVVNKVHEVAKAHNASHGLVVSHSQDAKKNPLTGEQKVTHAKNAFPGTNVSSASKDKPTILHHAAAAHAAGAQHLHVVAGSDRHEEMHKLLHKYNGQDSAHGHYNFKSITVHSSGERDPDSEGTTGISASKMREHAASGNKAEFHKGAPSKMKPEHKDAMYNDVRKGMNIKEETMDQQSDRAKQLNRFKDQMVKLNGPNKDTQIALDKKQKEEMTCVDETLRPEMGAETYINDFITSSNPKFNNKSKEERRKMAIGAYMAAKARGVKEGTEQIDEISAKLAGNYYGAATKKHLDKVGMKPDMYGRIEKDMGKNRKAGVDRALDRVMGNRKTNEEIEMIDELSTDLLGKYKTAAGADAKAADASGNYAKGDKRFKGINKATNKQFDNDLKKQNQVKEGTMQLNGTDQIQTQTSAPTASTSRGTTMSKKIKGFKFFNGENEKQLNMSQSVKEAINDNMHPAGAALLKHIKPEHHNKYKPFLAADTFNGSHKDRTDVLNAAKQAGHLNEEDKKEDPPFDGPYKSNFKKPNNPNRTGMDAARSLAQRAMDQLNTKKKEDIKEGERGLWDNIHAKRKRIESGSGERMRKPGSKGAPTADALKAAAESFEYNFDMLEEAVKSIDTGEYDYEGQMARTQLQTICRNSTDLIDMLSDEDNMPEWVQSKITLAQDYISTVRDYLQSKEELGEGTLDEKSDQARRNKTMKNMMDASRGARYKLNNPVPDTDHKTPQAKNKAIGRALRNESTTGNPGNGYHGSVQSPDDKYKETHAHVKNLTDGDDKTVKHYLDSGHGRHLAGRENDHEYIKKDFKKFKKYYKPEMHEAVATKAVNVDKVNHAGDKPHEEKWEPAKNVSKLKKEETMKTYKEFLQSLDEKLVGKQHKIDKNKNGKIDSHDFKLLRKEETEALDEIKMSELPSRKIQGKSYGADYSDPEGADETASDMKKAEKKPAGRKAGQSTGSYKPRQTMSKLKQAGATYK